jgi:hypothetical protein
MQMVIIGKNFLGDSRFSEVEFDSRNTESDFCPSFADRIIAFNEDRLITECQKDIAIGFMLIGLASYNLFWNHKNGLPRQSTALEGHMRLGSAQMLFMSNRPGATLR